MLQGLLRRDALDGVALQEVLREEGEPGSGRARQGQLLELPSPPVPPALGHLQQVPACGVELGNDIHQRRCGWVHRVGLWGTGAVRPGLWGTGAVSAEGPLMSREPPTPVTPYSPAAWSWRATAPRWVSPAVCPEGQGSLSSAKGWGEGILFSQEGVLSLSPRSQRKQPSTRDPPL